MVSNTLRHIRSGLAFTFVLTTVAITACGSSVDDGGSGFPGARKNGNNNGGPSEDDGFVIGDGGAENVNAKCATSSAQAEAVPVYLVFMYDRSGSMGDGQNGDPTLKWIPVGNAAKSFFSDSASNGLNASLTFFSQGGDDDLIACNANTYATPKVPMKALPDNSFAAAINSEIPDGGTPTLPALNGAIVQANAAVKAHPGAKVGIVLVTDGLPQGCDRNSVSQVAAAASAIAGEIPTYVIGVQDPGAGNLRNLNDIAKAGGTNQAFIIQVGNPQQTASDFQQALAVIRGQALSCEFKLPTPPAGKELDINSVNVVYTAAAGAENTLTYNASCNGGQGWHYDDAKNPSKIILCKDTCSTVQKDNGAKVDVVTGCATKGGVTR